MVAKWQVMDASLLRPGGSGGELSLLEFLGRRRIELGLLCLLRLQYQNEPLRLSLGIAVMFYLSLGTVEGNEMYRREFALLGPWRYLPPLFLWTH